MSKRRLAVVGTGLIGGSIGLAARAADFEVVGYDPDPAALGAALARGAVSAMAASPAAAAAGADLVVLAMPVDAIGPACHELRGALEPQTIITDAGSAKVEVVAAGEQAFGPQFVGGHPMAGSERHGIDAADARLFEDAWWILTPTATTSSQAYGTVRTFVGSLGATPVAIDPAVHDALIARLSHVPQLAASALVEVAAAAGDKEALLGLAAGGFRDVTRIAASNPDLWVAILRCNRIAVLDGLATLADRLLVLAGMIEAERWTEVRAFLDKARTARLELFSKPVYTGEPVSLAMMIPDRPGVLAEVTTEAGRLGANIEDLRIIHSTEGGRGRLELVVAGGPAAASLTAALTALGYHVERSELVE